MLQQDVQDSDVQSASSNGNDPLQGGAHGKRHRDVFLGTIFHEGLGSRLVKAAGRARILLKLFPSNQPG